MGKGRRNGESWLEKDQCVSKSLVIPAPSSVRAGSKGPGSENPGLVGLGLANFTGRRKKKEERKVL